ncbi:ATP-binding protein [Prevotella sp. P6B1]|uniref:HAMP domain-containing sensor histidine kinase n=1 Tax=Prevotella sp. P6B1 TaxID=1410613 RepID=UPI00051AB742|nr:ATP-binding protein [Prevotella sp. P6B1]
MSKHHRLSRSLSMRIILMAAPIFILSIGTLFLQSRYLIREKAMASANSYLNTALHRVRNYMSIVETSANSNAWMLEENLRSDSLKSVSNRIVRLNAPVVSSSFYALPDEFPEYGHRFSIYTEDYGGDSIVSYIEPDYDYFHRACYTEPVRTGKACWVDPFAEKSSIAVDHTQAIATYCQPIRHHSGRMMGVLTVDLSISDMASNLNKGDRPFPHAYFMMLAEDGRYLIHPDTVRVFRKSIFSDADPHRNPDMITLGYEMTAGKHGDMRATYDGREYYVCYRPVPGTKWSLALVCPVGDTLTSYYHMGYVIAAIIIIGLLLIVWLCNRLVKQTIQPIYGLLHNTQQIADGKYDELIPITTKMGVIGRLQNSFAHMQHSLNQRMGKLRKDTDEIRKHNDALEKSKALADETVKRKNLFIQHVAQQMRMPLNVILGFANVLRESAGDKNAMSEVEMSNVTSMMKSNAVNMSRMVLMLFDASETDLDETLMSNRKDEVACNEVARECIRHAMSHFPDAKIQMDTILPDTMHILTNHLYLMRTLRELLYNAAKYTDGQHVKLTITQNEKKVRFIVQDVGPGLSIDADELIFKPFVREGDLSEGLGLGLPLAKRHAKNLGGDLIFDADYHEGCRVVLEVPK